MPFDLPGSFMTGLDSLDSDHLALVARINSIAEHEQAQDRNKLFATLAHFMADLAEHIYWEEQMLKEMGCSQLESHTRHHSSTIAELDRLTRNTVSGASAHL